MKPDVIDTGAFWTEVERLTEAGELRRLSGVFARFVASLGEAACAKSTPLLLAALVLSELEGRGHSCLLLDDLAGDPAALLGWADEDWKALAKAAKLLPRGVKGWVSQLATCDQVWRVGDLDYDQPLVLDDTRLYLRRYWRDETLVANCVRTRAQERRDVDIDQAHTWLEALFGAQRAGETPDWQRIACAVSGNASRNPSPCAARSPSSRAVRAPVKRTRSRACWRCCSRRRRTPRASASHWPPRRARRRRA